MTITQMTEERTVSADDSTFTESVERHRHELQLHLYRMTASFEDAEDLVQETFLRAWRRRETYAARASFRAWLYKIATNAALDFLRARPRRAQAAAGDEVLWLQPYPDHLLTAAAAEAQQPDAVAVERETVELAFLVALQHLPPRQRAVLLVRDVLGYPAADTAELLELSVPSANSLLQRARETLARRLPPERSEWTADVSDEERAVVRRYVEVHEAADVEGVARLLASDVRFVMPPEPTVVAGRDAMVRELFSGGLAMGDWKLVPVALNRSPAVACYLRKEGEKRFTLFTLDVLRVQGGEVAEITTFYGERSLAAVGLPLTRS